MANNKLHVRPNGELGKCSAKIKCDFANEGAVHFEGPNAVADANAFQEKVATYIAFQESGGKFPADAEFDEDIVKFVNGQANNYSGGEFEGGKAPKPGTLLNGWKTSEIYENIAQKLQRQEDLSEREEEILDHTFSYDALLERQLVEDPRKWNEDEHAERFVEGIVNYAEPSNIMNDLNAGLSVFDSSSPLRQQALEDALTIAKAKELLKYDPDDLPNYSKLAKESAEEGYDISDRPALEKYKYEMNCQLHEYAKEVEESKYLKDMVEYPSDETVLADARKADKYSLFDDVPNPIFASYITLKEAEDTAKRWKERLKPGAYITYGNMDAMVYQVTEDGRLVTPDGKNWGAVNFERGIVTDFAGEEIHRDSGINIYGSEEELWEGSTVTGRVNASTCKNSADPGTISKWEDDDRFWRAYNTLTAEENYKSEVGHRNRIKATVAERFLSDKASAQDTYNMLKKDLGYTNDKWERYTEAGGANQGPAGQRVLKREMKKFIDAEITAGRLNYDDASGRLVKASRGSLESYKPKMTVKEAIGTDGNTAEQVSIRNAAVRKRLQLGSRHMKYAELMEPKPGRDNSASHRRRAWAGEKIPFSKVEDGNIIVERAGGRRAYVVVDAKNGVAVPVHNSYKSLKREQLGDDIQRAEDWTAFPAPEQAITQAETLWRSATVWRNGVNLSYLENQPNNQFIVW